MKQKTALLLFLIITLSQILYSASVNKISKNEGKSLFYIENKQFKKAISLINSDLNSFSNKDQMLYLLGRAYEEDKQLKKALSTFNQVIEKFPESQWKNKSYFRKSQILTQKKQFIQAYEILKTQLSRLLDKDRRSKFAEIYLNLAKEISFQKDKKKNDYKKALIYYQKAVEIGSLKENEDLARYRIGLCHYELKKYRRSKTVLEEFVKTYGKSEFIGEAHFYLGKIENHIGNRYKSRTHFLKVLKKEESNGKDKNLPPKTLYHIGQSYGLPRPNSEAQLELGVKYWRKLISKFPKHKLAVQSAYEIGLSYNRFSHLKKKAVKEFLSFISLYPNDKNAPLALESIGKILLDQNQFDKSLDYYRQFLKSYPNHRSWQNIQRQIINVKYKKGKYLFNLKKYIEAEEVFQEFLKKYPIESRNAEIMYLLGNIPYTKKNYVQAIEKWEKLHSKLPNNVMAHKALYSIAKIYLDKKFDFKKGIETLKKVRYNPWYRKAQNELQTLNRKFLSLGTKKLFFSTEKPTVHIQSRNIENYKINTYRLDLKEYFNRNQILSNIEQLDILLIKPDTKLDKKVEKYQKHKLFKQDLPLDIKKPGAYIISISSETLKASTLLIVSDIGVVVQGNKRELLLFTKNLNKETGEPNAKVYVSNGKKVILEGECDERGFFYHQFPKKNKVNINRLTVLVEKNGHYAGSGLSTSNFSSYDKKEYLGYIYSDKPIYKPGDRFAYKGILRVLQKGVLTKLEQNQFKVTFSSPSGKKIYEKIVKSSSYGTVNGKLNLPKTISTGWAKLRIEGIKKKEIVFEKSFEIARYTKPEKEILFETDKVAYFPRDKVKLKIIGKHLFGLPAAGKTLFYKIDRDSYKPAKLNESGEFELTIDTVKYGQKSMIRVYAHLEGGKKTFSKGIPIIIRDFSISLHSKKTLYLSDETAEITVKTLNHLSKGISKSLKAKLYLMKDGKENLTAEEDIETDDKGEGKVSFSFKEGGSYYVRIEGVGQNKIPVRNTVYFRVLKKEEKSKLFLLSENKPFKLGDESNIVLYSQGVTGVAVVTIKAKSIIFHRAIKVESEKTPIAFEVDKRLVPNFQISVTLIKQDKTHFTEKQFQVESGVKIKMETDKEVYKPGETLTLKLKTNNVTGKGISAESSVVLVDEGVLLLTGTRLANIKRYFYRLRRYPSHSHNGSTPYKYVSVTKVRNKVIAGKLRDMEKGEEDPDKDRSKGFGFYDAKTKIAEEKRIDTLYNDKRRYQRGNRPNKAARLEGAIGGMGNGATTGMQDLVSADSFTKKDWKKGLREVTQSRQAQPWRQASADEVPYNGPKTKRYFTSNASSSPEWGQVRNIMADVAYFNPQVVSDSDGEATVKIKLPKSHNRWKIIVISNDENTRFGMEQKSITVRKDFVVHLETPLAVVEGDKFSFDGDLLNGSKDKKSGKLSIKANNESSEKDYSVKAKGHFSFESDQISADKKDVEVTALTDYDGERRKIPVSKWGMTFYKGVNGSTEDSYTKWINLEDNKVNDPQFKLTIYPNLSQVLFKIHDLLGNANYLFSNTVSSHLITKLSLYNYLTLYEKDRTGDIERLKTEIRDKINFLLSSMNKNGGWNWIFGRGSRDSIVSAYSYYALSLAKSNKFKVDRKKLNKSSKFLLQAFSSLSNQDLESKIFILYALSRNNKANYSYVNRIYRNRSRLSLRGLNLLALTLHNMNRKGGASSVLSMIESKVKNPNFNNWSPRAKAPYLDFFSSKDDVVALTVLSYIKIKKWAFKAKPFMALLLNKLSRGDGQVHYVTHEFMAILSQAINSFFTVQEPGRTNYKLTVKWNDDIIFDKKVTGIHPPQTLVVNKNIKDKNKLDIRLEGNGTIYFSGLLSYFKPGLILENVKRHGYITKYVKYPNYQIKDKKFNFGYSTVQLDSYSYKTQKLENIAQHTVFPVSMTLHLKNTTPEQYLILEDMIPAGCTLLQGSVSGNFQYYKQEKNKLIFYLKRNNSKHRYLYINYKLISRFKGEYRTLPPQLYPIRNRSKAITGEVVHLNINSPSYNTFEKYKFSPDEWYHIGKYYFDQKNYAKSEEYLAKVFNAFTLKNKFYKEACRMFLYISLNKKNPSEVVKYFELLKERYPTLTIPFSDIIKIADSYAEINEYERAIQVLNGTIRSYFLQEVVVSATLTSNKNIKSAYNLMNQLILDYPDYPVVLKTYYTFGQEMYIRFTDLIEKPELKKKSKLKPDELFEMSKAIFQNYITFYPTDWNADEVSFTLLNLYLDDKKYQNTIDRALVYAKRFPKSHFSDGYKYIGAHALFGKGDYRLAQTLSKSVAYDKFPGKDGSLRDSENKSFAQLMLAKIYHQQKNFTRALEEYEKVSSHFEDARRSIEFIKEKKIRLKEVTQIKEREKNEVLLTFKGVNKVSLKLYKVNFTILCLKEKDLTNITQINLSGIKPFFEKEYKLTKNTPYTPIKKKIPLPIKEIGAYLLVFKSKNVQGSGIILKSDLSFDAIEKLESGRVRVTVLDKKNNFVKGVRVKFIGIGKDQYSSAFTDLRGTAEVDNFPNLSLVVGEKDGHYCFYRGKQPVRRATTILKPRPVKKKEKFKKELGNIRKQRAKIQQSNRAYWNEQSADNDDIQGVQIKSVY